MKNKILFLLTFFILCLSSFSISFAWLSVNTETTSGGQEMDIFNGDFKVYYSIFDSENDEWGTETLIDTENGNSFSSELNRPGKSVNIKYRIENTSTTNVYVTAFGLITPANTEEAPVTYNNTQYYLGSDLTSKCISINDSGVEGTVYTLYNPSNNVNISYVENGQKVPLNGNSSISFIVQYTFVNRGYNQNYFKNFGKYLKDGVYYSEIPAGEDASDYTKNGNCVRRLYMYYEP